MFAGFSGHGNSIHNIIPLLNKEQCKSLRKHTEMKKNSIKNYHFYLKKARIEFIGEDFSIKNCYQFICLHLLSKQKRKEIVKVSELLSGRKWDPHEKTRVNVFE